MTLKQVVVLGIVDAIATVLLKEGMKIAKENGVIDNIKERLDSWIGINASPSFA